MSNRNLAIKIMEGLNLPAYGDTWYRIEDFITSVLDGTNTESDISIDYFVLYVGQEVRDFLFADDKYEEIRTADFIMEVVDELLDEINNQCMGLSDELIEIIVEEKLNEQKDF